MSTSAVRWLWQFVDKSVSQNVSPINDINTPAWPTGCCYELRCKLTVTCQNAVASWQLHVRFTVTCQFYNLTVTCKLFRIFCKLTVTCQFVEMRANRQLHVKCAKFAQCRQLHVRFSIIVRHVRKVKTSQRIIASDHSWIKADSYTVHYWIEMNTMPVTSPITESSVSTELCATTC